MNTRIQTAFELGRIFDREDSWKFMKTIDKIKRLALKHQRYCEMDCNGDGWINGKHYHAGIGYGKTDDFYKGCISAYITENDQDGIFRGLEIETENKITDLASGIGCKVSIQGDPRDWTVRISYKGYDFSELIH